MNNESKVNDLVIRFANVNGTGSASANDLFAKAVFKMGIPLASKNIFPSNIQGLPTWFEVRVSEKGYLGRREGIDIMVAVNPQSFEQDVASVLPGGYFVYDNTKPLKQEYIRSDIIYIGIPMMRLCMENYEIPRQQQLFKNIVYIGAIAMLLDVELNIIQETVSKIFAKKEKLIPPNFKALSLGADYIKNNYQYPLRIKLERRDHVGERIMIDGNTACGIGAVYAGATFASWYPITPSTSVINAFEKYCKKLRVDPETGKNNFAIVQAEDELAAIGMAIGANWNGARAFTSTSGAGVSLMSEFIGLAYFAEIPLVLVNVQRGGPSTGMPTRTQQSDLLFCAYASHGDTKQILLFPSTPTECFDMTVTAFDLADGLQTPVIMMTDLDLGMNNHLTDPLQWDDNQEYRMGKVLSKEDLNQMERYGRYLDIDDDGICYRTIPGTHPTKGSFFTRGTSRDEYAKYTEDGAVYKRNMDRLIKKWKTSKSYVPSPHLYQESNLSKRGILFFGTSAYATMEAKDMLDAQGIAFDMIRIKAFPFNEEVADFCSQHEEIYIIEQNRDGQMKTLIMNELDVNPHKIRSVLNYDGTPITADGIVNQIKEQLENNDENVDQKSSTL
ncbi:MAG: 2-oxoacid:acceptor oxidoreductase subunit alpha [Reichenbachiella sp.]